ncbi:methyl-accepting chemotaxis protein [Planctomycetota bacterium]|nr:methyl-accepting chemotaxis protein [Planctomycetota bacterium]
MLNRFKISVKMAIGFSLVLALTAILGITAILQMSYINHSVNKIEGEVAPLTDATARVRSGFLNARLNVFRFDKTGDIAFVDTAHEEIKAAKVAINEISGVATKYNLEDVSNDVEKMLVLSDQYDTQINAISDSYNRIVALRVDMGKASNIVIDLCSQYLRPQHEKMALAAEKADNTVEVQQRNQKIKLINDVIDAGNAISVDYLLAQVNRDDKLMKQAIKKFDVFNNSVNVIIPMTSKQSDLDLLNNVLAAGAEYKEALIETNKVWDELADAYTLGGEIGGEMLVLAADIVNDATIISHEVTTSTRDTVSRASTLIIGGIAFALLLGGAIAYLITRGITKPIQEIVERIKDIAQGEGDLTKRVEIHSKDEIGELGSWFNAFVEKVHNIVSEVSHATHDVASAATEIAASAEEMAQGMVEQSDQVTQVSTAIEEMSSSVVEVAQKAANANNSATDARSTAEEGGEIVQSSVEGIQQIAADTDTVSNVINELGEQSDKIGEIILVINDIADQTNLLALNAAIEAARAGEHGRGFAVVADEVRKLADRTTQATDNINSLIDVIQTKTGQAVEQMNNSKQTVESGVTQAQQAGEALATIVTGSDDVAGMIQNIAAAAEQQSAAAQQISSNITGISAVISQNTEGANQAASAATQLSQKSEELQHLIGQFRIAS